MEFKANKTLGLDCEIEFTVEYLLEQGFSDIGDYATGGVPYSLPYWFIQAIADNWTKFMGQPVA